jgi:molybdopterin-guanine dinucleotide biosynthesis protein A
MTDFLSDVRAVRLPADPAGWTEGQVPPFFNLNTPDDLALLERVYQSDRP